LRKYVCSTKSVVLVLRVSFTVIYCPRSPLCHTLAQSTHLARRVRSFEIRSEHPVLAKALQNMTCLRNLTLLDAGGSGVLDGCIFSLDTFTCIYPYSESLLKFLQSQPSLRKARFLTNVCFPALDLEPTCLPNLTRITAPYNWLPHIVPGRPVSEVTLTGYPYGGNPVDFSFYTLSTVPIQKLAINCIQLADSERFLPSIFPSLTHLKVDVCMKIFTVQKVCSIPFYFI
jgi:hypothetical protein